MRNHLTAAFLAFTLGGPLLSSCGEVDDSKETTTPPTTAGKPAPAATALDAAAPLQANVFLELSGGMRGFMPANTTATEPTAFQQRIGLLASRTHSSPAVAEAEFWLSLNKAPQKSTYAHFREIVQGDTHEAALGTELPAMLENILALPGATNKVNVVVSDFIYGPKNQATSALMNVNITDALATATKKGLAVAVLGETSRFYGTFHPAVKTPRKQVTLKGETLPYYIWVIGPAAAVGHYVNEVLPATSAATQQAYFGLTFPKVPYAAVLTQVAADSPLAPSGNGSISYGGAGVSTNLEVDNVKDGVDFTVALDLRQLPAAWREPTFLVQHLQAQVPNGSVKLLPGSVKPVSNIPQLQAYTHTLRLHLSDFPKGGGQLRLTLPAPGIPAWVAQRSTENDNQPGPVPHTYRLSEIMNGVREAFPQALPPVFTATFTLAQD
ncbi:hypothetical protein E4631_13120 [Hymenobacter sp. UV11]|uniref:hypothetical protein n=1 Tax=Hymenobacter sp. UV11 TaxID=1849735 RepID=UPI00105C9286|nr:hypothetical protein [Hymenobacter sp. UV11]TFZ66030.1 hypothetical protein E4631_13120 [Hymenobacter sp. UV11]